MSVPELPGEIINQLDDLVRSKDKLTIDQQLKVLEICALASVSLQLTAMHESFSGMQGSITILEKKL